jgi:HTH-type transcriptional regulator / antitoxin HipB
MAVNMININGSSDLAQIVKNHRKKSGLSRNQLSLLSGIGKTAIYDIEHGKSTYQIDTLLKILAVLNIKLYVKGVVE